MSSKFSVLPLVGDHYATLVDARNGRRRARDLALNLSGPIGVGLGLAVSGFEFRDVSELLNFVAILSGFLFGLVVYVFQLRIQLTHDPRVADIGLVTQLIDELFANVAYAVLVGLTTGAVTVAAGATREVSRAGDLAPLSPWWSGVVVALSLHLLFTVAMCLKRTRAAYHRLTR